MFREPQGRAAAVKYAAKGQVLEFAGGPQGDAEGEDGGAGEPVGLKGEAGAPTGCRSHLPEGGRRGWGRCSGSHPTRACLVTQFTMRFLCYQLLERELRRTLGLPA